jgi:transglutaminase-like putative cysteine protease/sugar lactone lactonase YvrE
MVRCAVWIWIASLAAPVAAAPLGAVLGSIPTPGPCTTGLTFADGKLWVADHKTDTLYAVDPRSGRVLKRLPAPGYRPAGLAWDGKHLWNADPVERKLYRIDPGRGLVDHTVESPLAEPSALAWDGKQLWLASSRGGKLQRIDREDGTNVDDKPAPGRSTDGIAFDGRYLWLADRIADKLHVLDPGSGEVLASVAAPGPHATGLAFDGKQLWVADYERDRIYRVEARGDGKPARVQRRRQAVEYTHQLRNLGPDRLEGADLFLAIPSNDLSQRLLGAPSFTPKPTEILEDQWGQRVARFAFKELASGSFATVTMRAQAELFDVAHQVLPHQVKGAIPAAARRYLADDSKYMIRDPTIQRAVKEAVGGERNPYWIARKIYRYVHGRMFYKLEGGWNVAPRVLARGNGSCSEYSFVFIAMCRAAGVPARYVGSLVVRKDSASYDDVFHRWVEIYLPGYGWLPVDPSRGDKKSEVLRADAFGHLEPDFLITTRGGGGSRLLGWKYNAEERWRCRGRCQVAVESIAEWTPLRSDGRGSFAPSPTGAAPLPGPKREPAPGAPAPGPAPSCW